MSSLVSPTDNVARRRWPQPRAVALVALVLVTATIAACSPEGSPRRWYEGTCTGGATCSAGGLCLEGFCARPCTDGTDCGDGICFMDHCQPIESACKAGLCNDGNICTTDLCQSQSGLCDHQIADEACDDGNACTIGDECVDGICASAPKTCGAAQTCEPASGSCL